MGCFTPTYILPPSRGRRVKEPLFRKEGLGEILKIPLSPFSKGEFCR